MKHDGALDPVVVSAILTKLCETEKPDLVILGKLAEPPARKGAPGRDTRTRS